MKDRAARKQAKAGHGKGVVSGMDFKYQLNA